MTTMNHQNNNVFALDDSVKEIKLVNKYGKELGILRFKTMDVSIFERFKVLEKDLGEMMKQISQMGIKDNGEAHFEKDWDNLQQIANDLREKLNRFLDAEEEDPFGTIFKNCHPFSSVGGRFFVEQVLDVVGKVVGDAFQQETALAQRRKRPPSLKRRLQDT